MIHTFPEIETPALIIEKSLVEQNIKYMQGIADSAEVKLRPHTKTHKSPFLADMQIKAGATGIAVAKLGEAEVMADNGFRDIQIANIIVGPTKIERLLRLSERLDRLTCTVDCIEAAQAINDIFQSQNRQMELFIEVNTGHNRSGLNNIAMITELADYINNANGLKFAGLLTHAGQAYSANNIYEIQKIASVEGEFLVEIAKLLTAKGIEVKDISVGSTPTARYVSLVEGITEIRPGNYIFFDNIQVNLGSCSFASCALTVLGTVVSTPAEDRVIIDAGAKALSVDRRIRKTELPVHGVIIGKRAALNKISEEHGIISHTGESFQLGERLRIIPNHACLVMNLFDYAYLVDGDKIVQKIEILGRGKSQ